MSAGRGSSEVNAMYTASASYAMRPTVLAGGVVLSPRDRKSTRLNSSHPSISYAVFCLKKKNYTINILIVFGFVFVAVEKLIRQRTAHFALGLGAVRPLRDDHLHLTGHVRIIWPENVIE